MSQGPYYQPPPSSGGGKTVLIVVLVVFGVLGLLCLGVCGLGFYGVQQAGKVAGEFGDALLAGFVQAQAHSAVMTNTTVKEKLGEPLEFASASSPPDTSAGAMSSDFEVKGPKGKGIVHLEAQREGENWKIKVLQVRFSDGSVVDVDPNVAPVFPDTSSTYESPDSIEMEEEPGDIDLSEPLDAPK